MVIETESSFPPTAYGGRAPGGGTPVSRQPETRRPRYVIVVARDETDLWHHLRQSLMGFDGVDLVLDRRQGGRLATTQAWADEKPGTDRRRSTAVGTGLARDSVLIVQPAGCMPATPEP